LVSKEEFNSNFKDVSLVRKESQILKSGFGLFVEQDVDAGTIFGLNNYEYINDKAWENQFRYLYVDHIKEYTNCRFAVCNDKMYLQSIKNMKKGEELSRYYGNAIWQRLILTYNSCVDIIKETEVNHKIDMIIHVTHLERYNMKRREQAIRLLNCYKDVYDMVVKTWRANGFI
jgi:hypothetical protein